MDCHLSKNTRAFYFEFTNATKQQYIYRERNSNNNSNHHGRATERGCFEMCRCGRRSSRYDWRLAVVFTAMTTTTTIIFIVIVILQLLSSSSSNIYNNIYNITNDIITIHNNAIMCSPSLLTIHFFSPIFCYSDLNDMNNRKDLSSHFVRSFSLQF